MTQPPVLGPDRAPVAGLVRPHVAGLARPPVAGRPRVPLLGLTRASFGGRRYAAALSIDALGAGLLRPFLILYAVQIADLDLRVAGVALSLGLLAGLLALPGAGCWLDRGARSEVMATSLMVRAAGVAVLLLVPGAVGFTAAAVLLGIGTQVWPAAHAAVVSSLVQGRERDRVLAATRSLRNAGMGLGALLATVAVAGGLGALRWLAVGTGVGCLVAAVLVLGVKVTPELVSRSVREQGDGSGDGLVGRSVNGLKSRPVDGRMDERLPEPPGEQLGARRAGGRALRGRSARAPHHQLAALLLINLPYSLCFDVLEVALPVLLVTGLQVGPVWSSTVFVLNTVLVIATQVLLVVRLADRTRSQVLAGSGVVLTASYLGFLVAGRIGGESGALAVVLVSVLYTLGEVLYAGSGTALVVQLAHPARIGQALARWQLSSGLGRAVAPLVLAGLLSLDPALLWLVLATLTAMAAAAASRLERTAPAHAHAGLGC